MIKIQKHIEIVRSGLPAFSSMGIASSDMIHSVLSKHYARVGVTTINTVSDLYNLVRLRPDLVFLGMKSLSLDVSKPHSRLWLSALLDDHRLNYTGSNSDAIKLDFNKTQAKRLVRSSGLQTADFFMAYDGEYKHEAALPLPFPLFVKPPSEGGGRGIDAASVVRSFEAFVSKVQSIHEEHKTPALVESYLPGREFSVAMLQTTDELLAMPIELVTAANTNGDRILGLQVKFEDNERVTAVDDPVLKASIIQLSTDVYETLGARDYGRIDIRLDEYGVPHFIEANLIPGLAQHDFISYFTHACKLNKSMDHEAMILAITEQAMSRDPEPLPYPALPVLAT